ncbi:MAG: hydrogenase [Candidatus Omnitrophica bacterium]|nr:hydrogenase [Candidatus Omnitrophota bacterium]
MNLFIVALILIALGGLGSLIPLFPRRWEFVIGNGLTVVGCAVGLVPAVRVLSGNRIFSLSGPWAVPGGEMKLAIDPLSALFLSLLFIVSGSAIAFGIPYFQRYANEHSLKPPQFFLSGVVISMALLFTAQNAILFLASWEIMALCAFFLIVFEDHDEQVRKAGLLYMVMTHMGTLCLFVMFLFLGRAAGSFDFSKMAGNAALLGVGTPIFLLALIAFGIKAGFMPLHIWLQEAHPAAPSPVSALMSGVMIKTGIYGLVRVISFFPAFPAWWGVLLVMIGTTSGILGVLWALAQHDVKRLLAYHSIENIGIIALGLGFGCLGLSLHHPEVALLGLTGGLWHVLNHGLFKSLLFLGAGSVFHATGSRDMDRMGGLWNKMPGTGLCVLVGSVAICGLPPLNGFVSEWLIYRASFDLGLRYGGFYFFLGVPVLALIGVLAAACFTKAFGVQFLGSARTDEAARAQEGGPSMLIPMFFLAALCFWIGLFPGYFLPAIGRVAGVFSSAVAEDFLHAAVNQAESISVVGWLSLGIVAAIGLLGLVRYLLLRSKPVDVSATWGCGYAAASSRMQYTSSSYAQFSSALFHGLLAPQVHAKKAIGYFPGQGRFESHTPDAVLDRFLPWVEVRIRKGLHKIQRFQQGRIQFYLAYVLVFLIGLLIWHFHGVSLAWKKLFLLDMTESVHRR